MSFADNIHYTMSVTALICISLRKMLELHQRNMQLDNQPPQQAELPQQLDNQPPQQAELPQQLGNQPPPRKSGRRIKPVIKLNL